MLMKTFKLLFITLALHTVVESAALYKKSDDDTSMTCPSGAGGAGAYAVPNECKNYYFCTAGDPHPTLQTCWGDTLFSHDLRRCVVASRANCYH